MSWLAQGRNIGDDIRDIEMTTRAGATRATIDEAVDMTKTFERFLHAFTDEELIAFARERSRVRPPYWKTMQLALRIEADRRALHLDGELAEVTMIPAPGRSTHAGSA